MKVDPAGGGLVIYGLAGTGKAFFISADEIVEVSHLGSKACLTFSHVLDPFGSPDTSALETRSPFAGGMTSNSTTAAPRRRPRHRKTLSVDRKISFIRSVLSLKISEAAAIFRVERPTVYEWLAGNVQPQPSNQSRIDQVYRLARQWDVLSKAPLGVMVRLKEDGDSLVDLLSADEIPVQKVADHFDAFAHHLRTSDKGERMTRQRAGARVREAAAGRGLDPEGVEVDEAIDAATGRRTRDE